MRDISAEFGLDAERITASERQHTATIAVASLLWGLQPPRDTPLQRDCARLAESEWRRLQIKAMRARVRH